VPTQSGARLLCEASQKVQEIERDWASAVSAERLDEALKTLDELLRVLHAQRREDGRST
jgi:hypothetical protein